MVSSRMAMAARLVVKAGAGALLAVVPCGLCSTWASAQPARTHHHAPPPKLGPLSGKWSGSYGGTFSGTFTLSWQETGKTLKGTIKISGFGNVATSLSGTVKGSSISFGTVGSKSITYSGSVSGNSMSGSWQMKAAGQTLGNGSWHASRSS